MSEWIEWTGGNCPVELNKTVEYKCRYLSGVLRATADSLTWDHYGDASDIVRYRVVDETQATKPIGTNPANALKTQVGGAHYKGLAIQPIEYIHANQLGYCEANVVKYISRWRAKGGKQDLEKVKHYVDLLIQLEGL